MADFLTRLASLSLGGGLVVLLLLGVGRLTRGRYAARWRCWAWLLLGLRLALPFPLLSLPQAPVQLPAPSNPVIYEYTPGAQAPAAAGSSAPTASADPAPSTAPLPAQTETALPEPDAAPAGTAPFSLTLDQALFALWLAGALGVLGWNLVNHGRFCRYVRRWAVPVAEADTLALYQRLGERLKLSALPRLLRCPGVEAPMLAGLFRPAILLPEAPPAGETLEYALLHELTHLRRRDIPLKALMLWVNALHWFNPLIWWMVRAVEGDTELACDDGVLRALPPERRGAYSRAILDAVQAPETSSVPSPAASRR